MADHPLKPAIDHRLGQPLPNQLANLTWAAPSAINLSPSGLMRYCSSFPRNIPHSRSRSHALLTRALLHIAMAFNLHVLGLPPAFVLSQDQTLIFIITQKPSCASFHYLLKVLTETTTKTLPYIYITFFQTFAYTLY